VKSKTTSLDAVRRRELLATLGAACAGVSANGLLSPMAWAQAPGFTRPLRLVVPFTPGGSSDILARAIAMPLGNALHQTLVVDNKPGAGGTIGCSEVARSTADAQTLLMGHTGTLAINPALYPKLAYDPLRSFEPVALLARVPNVLAVRADFPAKTLADFVKLAKAQPGKYSFSSGGNGSAAHMTFELLQQRAGLSLVHVPYRGTAPSVNDLLAGVVTCTFTGTPALMPHLRSRQLRALAVSSARRIDSLPDVPTAAESGYAGFDADQWYGIVAPSGSPAPRVLQLNSEINRTLALPQTRSLFEVEGAIPMPSSPAAFGELIRAEIPRWAAVVKAGNVTVNG
jgi:tripartite-type tricarboxylate transporter receptor subunit TctC